MFFLCLFCFLFKGQWLFCVYPKRLFLTISAIDESVAVPEDRQRGILLANLLLVR